MTIKNNAFSTLGRSTFQGHFEKYIDYQFRNAVRSWSPLGLRNKRKRPISEKKVIEIENAIV